MQYLNKGSEYISLDVCFEGTVLHDVTFSHSDLVISVVPKTNCSLTTMEESAADSREQPTQVRGTRGRDTGIIKIFKILDIIYLGVGVARGLQRASKLSKLIQPLSSPVRSW